jgi:hypothetical protein
VLSSINSSNVAQVPVRLIKIMLKDEFSLSLFPFNMVAIAEEHDRKGV